MDFLKAKAPVFVCKDFHNLCPIPFYLWFQLLLLISPSLCSRQSSLFALSMRQGACLEIIVYAVTLSGLQFLQIIHMTHSLTSHVFFSVEPSLTTSGGHSLNCPFLFHCCLSYYLLIYCVYYLFTVFCLPTRISVSFL